MTVAFSRPASSRVGETATVKRAIDGTGGAARHRRTTR